MKTTPWRDLKHKSSAEEMESVRRKATEEAERLLQTQKESIPSTAVTSGKAA